jgi:hypothetical protein
MFGARTTLTRRPPLVTAVRKQANSGSGGARQRSSSSSSSSPGYLPPPPGGAYKPYQPVVPSAAYNPTLDIELEAGKRGTANTIEDLLTKRSRGDAGFAIDQGELQREEGEQSAAHDRALKSIAQGFQRLGVRQTEGANAAGVLHSGALAQAAQKRAANEATAREPVDVAYAQQQGANKRALARLALAHQQEGEDTGTGISRAEREQAQFGIDTRTVENREATNNGYLDSGGVIARTSQQRGAGFVKVGQPLRPWGRR